MVVVGFGFTKILVERLGAISGKINIKNNVGIKAVEEKSLALGQTKKDGIRFEFEFTSEYEPNVGKITIVGEVLYMEESSKIKEIMSMWEKDKKIPKDIMANVLNNILAKCNIQALILSQEVNLPAPIPLPKVEVVDAPAENQKQASSKKK